MYIDITSECIGINVDKKSGGALTKASSERKPITGVWGQSPHRGPRAELSGDRTSKGRGKLASCKCFK